MKIKEIKRKYGKQMIIGLVSGFLNGLFGAGGGSVVVPAMEHFLQMEEKKAHATAIGIILLYSLVSAAIYLVRGFFDFGVWIPVTAGGIAGGVIGAKLLARVPKRWLKIGFGVLIVVTAVKMIR